MSKSKLSLAHVSQLHAALTMIKSWLNQHDNWHEAYVTEANLGPQVFDGLSIQLVVVQKDSRVDSCFAHELSKLDLEFADNRTLNLISLTSGAIPSTSQEQFLRYITGTYYHTTPEQVGWDMDYVLSSSRQAEGEPEP